MSNFLGILDDGSHYCKVDDTDAEDDIQFESKAFE